MKRAVIAGVLAVALGAGVGCSSSYEDERPPVDQLDSRDEGLQSKEIVNATDQMAQSILGDPDINARTERLIIVADKMEDQTASGFPKDLFIRRLKVSLGKHGKGRITLVENRDRLRAMQSRELEGVGGDEFGQGGGGRVAPGPAGLQPDFALNGTITEMRKQGTSYYFCEFRLTGLKGPEARVEIWTDAFEVKVAR